MTFQYKFSTEDFNSFKKLNGRRDFHCRIHQILQWGIAVWTKDGYDVLTLSKDQQRAFSVKVGDYIIVYDNQLWFPFTSFKENTTQVLFAKFKIGTHFHNTLAINIPGSKSECYSTVSAVHAFTLLESDIRPQSSEQQRKAFTRWIANDPIRARFAVSELTTTNTELLADFVDTCVSNDWENYTISNYSTMGPTEFQLRLAFAHLGENKVLEYLWNQHQYCGLFYRKLYKRIAALYCDSFCIVSVAKGSRESGLAETLFRETFAEDLLGITITKPILNVIRAGCIDDTFGVVLYPSGL